ncbi:hypothetical protein Dsin_008512 [Dipteronia sinensis]|uniref:Uncharacterized protein n=1 Tax=Dipteronia sinensis TaxID=43782 RepID=A0AAE0AQ30_9ROSI|nr:hypothetical protein Dsin_008512 [Dipteronia sinensis]
MNEVEIAKLYENLSLTDEDGVVLKMVEEVRIEGVEDVDRCLVRKVMAGKKVNREAFKGLIEQIWNPFGSVEIEMVRLDISKPLKRWLRLKLGKTEEVTIENGSSSDRSRSFEVSRETEGEGSASLRFGSMRSNKNVLKFSMEAPKSASKEKIQQTLLPIGGSGLPQASEMCIDEPGTGVEGSSTDMGLLVIEPTQSPSTEKARYWHFRFELFWLKEDKYSRIMKEAWTEVGASDPIRNLKMKLSWSALALKVWSSVKFRKLGKQIEEKNREIDSLYNSSGKPWIMHHIKKLEKTVEGLLDCEEIFGKQRSIVE